MKRTPRIGPSAKTGAVIFVFLAFCIVYNCSRSDKHKTDKVPDYRMPADQAVPSRTADEPDAAATAGSLPAGAVLTVPTQPGER
jgi:hypothetical protein